MLIDMVMNDLISKSNQPNAPTDRAFFLPSSLPTALGMRCSENCGQFAASLLCLGSLKIICLFAHVALDFSVFGCFHRDYVVDFFVKQEFTTKVRRRTHLPLVYFRI